MKKKPIQRLEKAIRVNSSLANAIFVDRKIEAEGDLLIPRTQIKRILLGDLSEAEWNEIKEEWQQEVELSPKDKKMYEQGSCYSPLPKKDGHIVAQTLPFIFTVRNKTDKDITSVNLLDLDFENVEGVEYSMENGNILLKDFLKDLNSGQEKIKIALTYLQAYHPEMEIVKKQIEQSYVVKNYDINDVVTSSHNAFVVDTEQENKNVSINRTNFILKKKTNYIIPILYAGMSLTVRFYRSSNRN